jgi:YD repeat-containing protein
VQGTVVSQAYGYDAANRRLSIQEGSNTQTYGYDFAGNRSGQNGGAGQFPLSSFLPGTLSGYNAQNNQLTAGQYTDGRGNLNAIGSYGFTYDGENRLATAQLNSSTVTYGYDGNGHRVVKTAGGQTITYVYDVFGNLATEYGGTTSAPCAPCYLTVDALAARGW